MTVLTNDSGQIQTTEQKTETIREVLQDKSVRAALNEVLPKGLDVPRFARVAMSALRNSPKLMQCSPQSFLSALLQSATLGLEPNTPMGHSYLIPYGKECTLVVGYQGYIDLAYRSGVVTSIHANVVREGDEFEWSEGSEPYIRHKPLAIPQSYQQSQQTYLSGRDTTHVYAIARLLAGGHVQVVMLKAEIDAIRSRSRAAHDGPWVTDPVAMQKKTAIRQLRKFLPMSPQGRALHMAAGLDEMAESGLAQTFDVPDLVGLQAAAVAEADTEVATDDGPTEYGRCPLHGSAWSLNKYGYSHQVDGSNPREYCKPSSAALVIAEAVGMDADLLNGWLRQRYGITRSKMELEHLDAFHAEVSSRGVVPEAEVLAPEPADVEGVVVVPEGEQGWPE
jgi:recombination protein RecT